MRTIIISQEGCPGCERAKALYPDAEVYMGWEGIQDFGLGAELMSVCMMAGADKDVTPLVFMQVGGAWVYVSEWEKVE